MRAETTARMRTVPPIASVTCMEDSRPSQRSVESSSWVRRSRSAGMGTRQSTSSSTTPETSVPTRVQFSNGWVVKWEDG